MWGRIAVSLTVGATVILITVYGEARALAPAGQIFIAEQCRHRLVRINDMTGAGWTTFSGYYDSIFVNSAGQIFLGEYARIVRINDMSGAGLTTFGNPDIGIDQPGRFCGPHIFVR